MAHEQPGRAAYKRRAAHASAAVAARDSLGLAGRHVCVSLATVPYCIPTPAPNAATRGTRTQSGTGAPPSRPGTGIGPMQHPLATLACNVLQVSGSGATAPSRGRHAPLADAPTLHRITVEARFPTPDRYLHYRLQLTLVPPPGTGARAGAGHYYACGGVVDVAPAPCTRRLVRSLLCDAGHAAHAAADSILAHVLSDEAGACGDAAPRVAAEEQVDVGDLPIEELLARAHSSAQSETAEAQRVPRRRAPASAPGGCGSAVTPRVYSLEAVGARLEARFAAAYAAVGVRTRYFTFAALDLLDRCMPGARRTLEQLPHAELGTLLRAVSADPIAFCLPPENVHALPYIGRHGLRVLLHAQPAQRARLSDLVVDAIGHFHAIFRAGVEQQGHTLWRTADLRELAHISRGGCVGAHIATLVSPACAGALVRVERDGVFLGVTPRYVRDMAHTVRHALAACTDAQHVDAKDDARVVLAADQALAHWGAQLGAQQRAAVRSAVRCHIAVVEGGAGTGKTSGVIARLIEIVGADAINVVAPTGSAAQRVNERLEAGGMPRLAKTMDMLWCEIRYCLTLHLAFRPWLLLEEMSMDDVQRLSKLLAALPALRHVVLVGDLNQIDPIGFGAPCRDIAALAHSYEAARVAAARGAPAPRTPAVYACAELLHCYRTSGTGPGSIAAGARVALDPERAPFVCDAHDLSDIEVGAPASARAAAATPFCIEGVVGTAAARARLVAIRRAEERRHSEQYTGPVFGVARDEAFAAELQLICMRNADCDHINDAVAAATHPATKTWPVRDRRGALYPGRKMMFTQNAYELQEDDDDDGDGDGEPQRVSTATNGEIFTLTSASDRRRHGVRPGDPKGGSTPAYPTTAHAWRRGYARWITTAQRLREMNLAEYGAYNVVGADAITGHKSQGNEWDAVVVLITVAARRQLTRNMLYTLIMRARRHCTVVMELTAAEARAGAVAGATPACATVLRAVLCARVPLVRRTYLAAVAPTVAAIECEAPDATRWRTLQRTALTAAGKALARLDRKHPDYEPRRLELQNYVAAVIELRGAREYTGAPCP